jgi:diguanylate cyclase
MNDVSAIAGQLSKLRERLDQKEQELGALSEQTESERSCTIQFITRLTHACRGHDRELDNKLAKLRQRFEEQTPLHLLSDEILAVEKLLQQHATALEESLRLTRETIKEGGRHLSSSKELPEKIRKEAREFFNLDSPYAIAEHQRQVARLLELYQQAMRAMLLRPGLLKAVASTQVTTEPTDGKTDEVLRNKLCDELQRLITELDFTGPVGEELAEIRRKLLTGIDFVQLPELCLHLVELIIEGARQERRESHLFLSGLNDSLSAVHLRLHESLDEGKSLQQLHQRNGDEIHARLDDISSQLDQQPTLELLKASIRSNLSQLQSLLLERQVHQQREQQLLDAMSSMEARLNLMKEETSEYKKRMSQQKHKLLLDSLTQVFNRAAFDERIDLEYKRWLRYQAPLCLAIIDIDHFKSINDRFGHLAGDKALKVIARAMSRTLRETDFIARYGGEEFVVLLPGIDASNLQMPLDKLRNVVKGIPFRFKDDKVEITISIGTTLFRSGDSPIEAFERADKALYEAKNGGRDRIIYAD